MSVNVKSERKSLRKLIPLSTLPGPEFNSLCNEIQIEEQEKGYFLFNRGDTDHRLIYLLSGEVSLEALGLQVETISAEDEHARFALAHQIPRKIDAMATTKIRFIRIDPEIIKNLIETSSNRDSNMIDVDENAEEESSGGDWMTQLLKTPIFRLIPASSLQKILISLEEIDTQPGEIIIHQDDMESDYYYIIKQGVCALTRKPTPTAREIKLAELKQGEAFGEGSILSGQPRDVTVTALTPMSLLRLKKDHFLKYIRDPIIKQIDQGALHQEIENGSIVVDVRAPDEFEKGHIETSINIPFIALRMNLRSLDRRKKIILVCQDGKMSEAAAFILFKSKYEAYVLKGGMNKRPSLEPDEEASFEIDDPNFEEETIDEPSGAAQSFVAEEKSNLASAVNSDEKLALLIAENQKLKREVAHLQGQIAHLRREKDNIERQYRNVMKNRKG